MECDICSRAHTPRLPFNCTTCARNVLYQPRLEHARVLVERAQAGSQIEQELSSKSQTPRNTSRCQLEVVRSDKIRVDNRAEGIHAHIEILRREIKNARQEISARKAAVAQRRRTIDAVGQTLGSRRTSLAGSIEVNMAHIEQAWSVKSKKLESHRAFLCREAAKLYGLKSKRRVRHGVITEQYSIGGVFIPDLREINNLRPEELSAVIATVAHFLLLVSHYLSVRLPAEIVVPHRAYPRPTIYTPSNSYAARQAPSPGHIPDPVSSAGTTGSRQNEAQPGPRIRPLFVEKRLPQLAHDDSTAYSLFIEALSLLAWDIAWLCRSQGFIAGTETWEDVCCIGRNLWQMFGSSAPVASLTRARSSRDVSMRHKPISSNDGATPPRSRSLPRLGQYSHGSANAFLANNEGLALFRSWKLTRYSAIADSLKRTLIGEMSNAEWELLEEREWDDGTGDFNDETVFVKNRDDQSGTAWDDARSIMTVRTKASVLHDDSAGTETETARAKGTSGWTKLKPRDKT